MAHFNTPILLITYNRPDLTARVLETLRQIQPCTLFVACDGPNMLKEGDVERCHATRLVVDQLVERSTALELLLHDKNLGCKEAVTRAITWFFEHVEEGIILEDDCLPSPYFFQFAAENLRKYRCDHRVLTVGGNCFLSKEVVPSPDSYYFSKYPHVWGWGTWARAWKHYDASIADWKAFVSSDAFAVLCPNPAERTYWTERFREAAENASDRWDDQLVFCMWRMGALSACPSRNLVTNIGFDERATHTKSSQWYAGLPANAFTEISHPPDVSHNAAADDLVFAARFIGTDGKQTKPSAPLLESQQTAGLSNHGVHTNTKNRLSDSQKMARLSNQLQNNIKELENIKKSISWKCLRQIFKMEKWLRNAISK